MSVKKFIVPFLLAIVIVFAGAPTSYAAGEDTKVYVNGIELDSQQLTMFESWLGTLSPGYYWVDQNLNFGQVGGSCSVDLNQIINGATNPCNYGFNNEATVVTTETDQEIKYVSQQLNGHKILASWRQGGAIYGTYFFEETEYCNANYHLVGHSERTTILDNIERRHWQNQGTWRVTRHQGQLSVEYQPVDGESYSIPVTILSNGSIKLLSSGGILVPQGSALCQ